MDDFLKELKTITTSNDFLSWLQILNGGTPEVGLTNEKLINGYCEDLAVYLNNKYNVTMCMASVNVEFLKSGHFYVLFNNKYYDGIDISGVTSPCELVWSSRIIKKAINLNLDANLAKVQISKVSVIPVHDWYKPHLERLHS